MREIKYKFWLGHTKKMTYEHSLIEISNAHWDFTEDIIPIEFTGKEDADINGNEIYDTDIIENCDTKDLQMVYWNEDEAAWYCRYVNDEKRIVSLSDSLGNLNKKVGNFYENPELLNN